MSNRVSQTALININIFNFTMAQNFKLLRNNEENTNFNVQGYRQNFNYKALLLKTWDFSYPITH